MRLAPFTLSGRCVELRPLAKAHAEALLRAANRDRSTYGHTLVPVDQLSMARYIDGLLAEAANDSVVPFAQVRHSDGALIGCTRFMSIGWWPGRETPAEVEVGGTWLAGDAQRQPFNTEAKLLMLTHAFEQWQVFRVALCTDAKNQRSRDAIERIGASFEGILRRHRPSTGALGTNGEARDTAVYSIIDSEWPAVREALQRRIDV